jgi:ribonuclease P protein component
MYPHRYHHCQGMFCARIDESTTVRLRQLCVLQKSFRRAVDRNLLRRRIRDVFRRNKSVWPERTDMVIVLSSGGAPVAA